MQGRVWIWDPHHPFCHLPQGLVLRVKRLECIRPLSVPPLLDLEANPPLQAIDSVLGSGVPVNLPVSPQPILLANIRKNSGRIRG